MTIDALALQELRDYIDGNRETGLPVELDDDECDLVLALMDERDARIGATAAPAPKDKLVSVFEEFSQATAGFRGEDDEVTGSDVREDREQQPHWPTVAAALREVARICQAQGVCIDLGAHAAVRASEIEEGSEDE